MITEEGLAIRTWLIDCRKTKSLTQERLAKKCGVTRQLISFIEGGKRRPSVELAMKIGKVLDFDWTKFFNDEHSKGVS